MSFNGKIRRRRGINGISKTFSVVENFRRKDTAERKPTNRVVLYLGTLKNEQWMRKLDCEKFWQTAEREIDAAVLARKIPVGDARKVKEKLIKDLGLATNAERAERWASLIARYPILER